MAQVVVIAKTRQQRVDDGDVLYVIIVGREFVRPLNGIEDFSLAYDWQTFLPYVLCNYVRTIYM